MSADPDERFNEICPPALPQVMCSACVQSAHTSRPTETGCECSCHRPLIKRWYYTYDCQSAEIEYDCQAARSARPSVTWPNDAA